MMTEASATNGNSTGIEYMMAQRQKNQQQGNIRSGVLALTLLVGSILLMIYLALALQLSDEQLSRIVAEKWPSSAADHQAISAPLDSLRAHLHELQLRMLLLGLLVFAFMIGAVIVIRRRFVMPLADIQDALQRIATGKLDQKVSISGEGEIASMGAAVNDIAANQQEVLLHLWSQTKHSIDLIDRIADSVKVGMHNGDSTRVRADLNSVRSNMENLKGLTDGITYYNVRLEDNTVVAPEPLIRDMVTDRKHQDS